jgi:Outer membrane protein beta-barrel family/CarboxypepD_reg-like domain
MPFKLFAFLWLLPQVFFGQNFLIEGTILNTENEPLSYVNVVLTSAENPEGIAGTTTDENGMFKIENVSGGTYGLNISMIGYTPKTITINLLAEQNLGPIILAEEAEGLEEVTVSVTRPSIQKTAGKLIFNVENSTLSNGNSLSLLSKTPGVIVLGESISIKNRPTTVYLNGRRVYLSKTEMNAFLENLDASVIKSVEVITNPSSEYDAESGTVLNIITTKAVAPGYKGTLSGTYEQAVFSKYKIGTSHFFKNNWLNLFGSYSYSPRKENKDQDSYIRYTETNPTQTAAIWESEFNRITRSYGHQANLVADIDFDDKNSLNLTANVSLSPDKKYENIQNTSIYNNQRQLDSTFVTHSEVNIDANNLLFGADYKTALNSNGGTINIGTNYISYTNDQNQQLQSDYYLPNGDFLKTIQFDTDSRQDTEIITGHFDLNTSMWEGNFESGLKYSHIDTRTGLNFFDIINGTPQFNASLSDLFDYEESIYAAYVNFDRELEKWNLNFGLRGEYTDVSGISKALGNVNTQEYFKIFPAVSLEYKWNENNSTGLSYARKIQRPRYQSLNPFRYFLNENNFNIGNPNLVPAIEDKITFSYAYKGKWFLEMYYQHIDNSLEILNFQDNENFTLRQLDANMVDYFQYSLDLVYSSSITDWWFASYITSGYYLENEFLALESVQETYTNSTFGFYGQAYNQFTLTEDGTFTSELTASYVSNLISGSLDYNNIFNLSLSFRKSLWNKSASISSGVDDIFNTNNVPVTSRYLNQDNSYFAMPESRQFWIGFQYNFGNYALRENKKNIKTQEGDRLQ